MKQENDTRGAAFTSNLMRIIKYRYKSHEALTAFDTQTSDVQRRVS